MLHPEREWHAEFEGPALHFFYALPKGDQFWFTRIVYEPIAHEIWKVSVNL
jgi:hypothetical protein